uniref:CSON004378 protein n=1 Tax=Culicoides sonorensis TaxID=179676 RepID=A0A336MNX9_CULSO
MMDMTSAAEARSWYENQRLGGSPNTGASTHQSSGGVDTSDVGAFYPIENGSAHRRYGYPSYGSHGEFIYLHLIFCVNASNLTTVLL